jgi:hypothetical protein
MRLKFEATEAAFVTQDDALVCGVSGADSAGAQHCLTFQRDAEDTDDDWRIHLEYDDQINGDYDCVRSCRLSRFELQVSLSRQLGRLEGVEGFDILLRVHHTSYEALRSGLERVFRGKLDAQQA